MTASCLDEMRELLGNVLKLGKRTAKINADTRLFGSLAELDSMALIIVVAEIEERFDIRFDDEEINGETFETMGSLVSVVDRKRSA